MNIFQKTVKGVTKGFTDLKGWQKLIVGAVVFFLVAPSFLQRTVGGFESITADWNRVTWNEYTDTSGVVWPYYEKNFDFLTDTWDGNERFGSGLGIVDWARYRLETDQPKFNRTLETHPFTLNGSYVYNDNGAITGIEQRDYEWGIDQYTVSVSISTVAAYGKFATDGATFWLRFQNNAFTVFDNPDDAAGYIIQAHVGSYSYTLNHPNHIVVPTQGAYELNFVGVAEVAPPEYLSQAQDIDLAALQPFSDVEIPFKIVDLSPDVAGADCTVNVIVVLNVLRVGVWNYILDYESGGRDRGGTGGSSGWIGTLVDSVLNGIGDLLGGMDLVWLWPIVILAIVALIAYKTLLGTPAKLARSVIRK